jgi:hypothetical protein
LHAVFIYLIMSSFQAIAAIRERFPDSGIVKRLNVLSDHDANLFLRQWRVSRSQEEAANDQSSVLRNAFHESPTQNAFSSISAQMHGMNQFMESTSNKLAVLTRRTDPLSPSKHPNHNHPHPPTFLPINFFPYANNNADTPNLLPSTSSKSVSHHVSEPESPHLNTGSTMPSSTPNFLLGSNVLIPILITLSNQPYHVLPLTPPVACHSGPSRPLVHTAHDLILPPASAFFSSTYPTFSTVDCSWQYLLDKVMNPSCLWLTYAPGSLGDYEDVKSLWQTWDEGAYVKDIGRKPAMRLIDARWGNLESKETHKRKYPSWRPRNDNKVCLAST